MADYRTSPEIQTSTYRVPRFDGIDIDEHWVRDMIVKGQRDFSTFQTNCDRADMLADGRFNVGGPRDFPKLKLPLLYNSLLTSVRHISAGTLDIGVKPRTMDVPGEETAERIERFLENAHTTLDNMYPCNEHNLFQIGKYSVGIRKIQVNNEMLSNLPSFDGYEGDREEWKQAVDEQLDDRLQDFPFSQVVCDPRQVMWDYVSHRPRWLIWRRDVETAWIQANCPDWVGNALYAGTTTLTEIWTETQFALWARDKWALRPIRHPLGMIPFVIFQEINDEPSLNDKPHDRHVSRFVKSEPLIRAHARLMSTQLAIAQNTAIPIPLIRGDGAEVESLVDKLKANPLNVYQIPSDAEILHTPTADTPRAVENLVRHLDEMLSQSHFSASQNRNANAQSGYQLSIQNHLQQVNLIGMKRAMERGIVQMNEILLRLVERWIRAPVSMFGNTSRGKQIAVVTTKDIKGAYDTTCELNADTPEEQSRKWDQGMRAASGGWLPHELTYDFAGIPHSKKVYQDLLRQKVETSDPVLGVIIQQVVEQMMAAFQSGAITPSAQVEEVTRDLAANVRIPGGGAGNITGEPRPNQGQFGTTNQAGTTPGGVVGMLPNTQTPQVPGSPAAIDLALRQQRSRPGERLPQ